MLNSQPLVANEGLRGFSVAFDLRVVFYFTKDKPKKAVLVDIGKHDEVY
jgi:mRNA-degrading endonuclease YafQ of YafQ-DinJ toxin-antitoxin module